MDEIGFEPISLEHRQISTYRKLQEVSTLPGQLPFTNC